jgi:hypothetical protein
MASALSRADIGQGGDREIPCAEIEAAVWEGIRKTINKFREHPYYFFTESDIATYLCQCLYTSRLECERDGKRIYCVHREYPTNFRYDKDRLLDVGYQPYELSERKGTRGSFDLAVIDPEFVLSARSVEDIVNKNVRDLERRFDSNGQELVFAIEFKYVINSSRAFESQIRKDNRKLQFARHCGVRNAVNLTFCNCKPAYERRFVDAVASAGDTVTAFFVQSYYDGDKKITPKTRVNAAGPAAGRLRGTQPICLSTSARLAAAGTT